MARDFRVASETPEEVDHYPFPQLSEFLVNEHFSIQDCQEIYGDMDPIHA